MVTAVLSGSRCRLNGGFSEMGAGNLILVNEPRCLPVHHFPLEDGLFVCGRATDCHLVVPNVTVSRRHAQLHVNAGQVEVIDLASRNGTFVRGQRIERASLAIDDQLRFGEVAFLLSNVESDDERGDGLGAVSTRRIAFRAADLPVNELSPTQRNVLDLLLDGLAEKEIAKALSISTHTAHHHVSNIYNTLGIHSRAELLAHFVNKGEANGITRQS